MLLILSVTLTTAETFHSGEIWIQSNLANPKWSSSGWVRIKKNTYPSENVHRILSAHFWLPDRPALNGEPWIRHIFVASVSVNVHIVARPRVSLCDARLFGRRVWTLRKQGSTIHTRKISMCSILGLADVQMGSHSEAMCCN